MNLIKNFNNSYFNLIFVTFFIISFIFLSGLKYEFFQFRFLIVLLLLPCILKICYDLKARNFDFIIFFSLLLFILCIHIGLNLYFEKVGLTKYSLFGVIFLLSIFTISYYYYDFVNKNIDFIIKFFLIIFFSSCLYSIYDYRPDSPYFCGGIPNFIKSSALLEKYSTRIDDVRFSFKEFIFPENSHLGMIAPSVLIYSIYKCNIQKISFTFKIFTSFFFYYLFY